MRDADVRFALLDRLERKFQTDSGTRVIEEMGIWSGAARVDIAVVNGELHGYELKSAKDNLDRLPNQVSLYNQVFDRVTIVVAERHLTSVEHQIPPWWGVIVASSRHNEVQLSCHRKDKRNYQVIAVQLARLLWREELLKVLKDYDLARGILSKPLDVLIERLVSSVSLSDLRYEVRAALKRRRNWLGQPVRHQG